jgi:hypothetical protein
MSSLLEFNRVYRLEIQSVLFMLVFSTGFVKHCPYNRFPKNITFKIYLAGSSPPFPVLISILSWYF